MFEATRYEYTHEIPGFNPYHYAVVKVHRGWMIQRWDGLKIPPRLYLKTPNGWCYGLKNPDLDNDIQYYPNEFAAMDAVKDDVEQLNDYMGLAQMA